MSNSITRSKVHAISEDVMKVLALVGEKHGVEFQRGRWTFDDNQIRMKIDANNINEGGDTYDKKREDFKRLASHYGLSPDDLDRRVILNGKPHYIRGCKPGNFKYPILAETVSGKMYKWPASTVQRAVRDAA